MGLKLALAAPIFVLAGIFPPNQSGVLAQVAIQNQDNTPINIEISTAVWPCFAYEYSMQLTSLERRFDFTKGISVKVKNDADFLSEDHWQKECMLSNVSKHSQYGLEKVEAPSSYNLEILSKGNMDLEGFLSFSVSFEIWRKIGNALEKTGRMKERYFVAHTAVESVYRYAEICNLNEHIRIGYPQACDYSRYKTMFADALEDFQGLSKTDLNEDLNKNVLAATQETATKAQIRFGLIKPWAD